MLNKNILATAIVVALAVPTLASADPIVVDPDAGGPQGNVGDITSFDWGPANVIATTGDDGGNAVGVGGNQAIANFINGAGDASFQVLGHGVLGNFLNSASNPIAGTGLNADYEWTFEFGFGEVVTGTLGGLAAFGFAATDADGDNFANFFNVYYNPVAGTADHLSGTGFNSGTLVLSGHFTGLQSNGVVGVTGNFDSVGDVGSKLDSFGGASGAWASGGVGGGARDTVDGSGSNSSAQIDTSVGLDFVNGAFIKSTITELSLANISQNLPYVSVDPSEAFALTSGAAPTSIVAGIGSVNGGLSFPGGVATPDGSDVLFQTDLNGPVDGVNVPTPATLALFGSALGLMGAWRRRRSTKA